MRRGHLRRAAALLGLAAAMAVCGGCSLGRTMDGSGENGENGENGEVGRLKVTASLFPYYDFAREIGGEEIDLELIIPAGMDSHSFEPTPEDIRKIQESDILLCNGGEMETWLRQVLEAVDTEGLTVVTMMDYVDAVEEKLVEGMEDAGHDHSYSGGDGGVQAEDGKENGGAHAGELDEHIWTSVRNAEVFADVIGRTLAAEDTGHSVLYRERADIYVQQLRELDQEFKDMVDESQGRMIVVADKFPFRYLAEDYGLSYRAAFSGCSSDSDPSAKTIAYLIDTVRQLGIPAVYYLELATPRVAEIIGEETGAEPLLLHSCHNVTRKDLNDGVTYLQLMKNNLENLRKGLNGWKS